MHRWLLNCILTICLIVGPHASAPAEPPKRVALVIGIGDYAASRGGLASLDHPVPDALAVATELKKLGFKTTFKADLTKSEFLSALDAFVRDDAGADLVLIYFAGHGIQIARENYLVPSDATNGSAADLERHALLLEELFNHAAAVAPHGKRIIFVDACRNLIGKENAKWTALLDDPERPIVAGLGRIGKISGSIIAFATQPGYMASDGAGEHSPFATAILAHIGAKVFFSSAIKIIQQEVYDKSGFDEETHQKQLPYIEDGLPDARLALADVEPLDEREQLLFNMAGINPDVRSQVERIAHNNDVPLAPLYGALIVAAGGGEDAQVREKQLESAAKSFLELQNMIRTLSSSDPKVTELRKAAESDLALGKFEAVHAELRGAKEIDQAAGKALEVQLKTDEANLKARNLSEAASLALDAEAYMTQQVHIRDAANELAQATQLAERWQERQLAWKYTIMEAYALDELGELAGETAALSEAIDAYGKALTLTSRSANPGQWAMTEHNLGDALDDLGGRTDDTALLEEAVRAYREALSERPRERMLLEWADTQSNLGGALIDLGTLANDTARLEEAVATFGEVLREPTRERAPDVWARAENRLGNALETLGERTHDAVRFKEAITAYREALKETPQERNPIGWALTENNLGIALRNLGDLGKNTELLENAVTAYREALKQFSRERTPLKWAKTENNLGLALQDLGEHTNDTALFKEAVIALGEALKESARESPRELAGMQFNFGNALSVLGERTNNRALLENAVTAYREALKGSTGDDKAKVELQLALVLILLGPARFEEAHAAVREVSLYYEISGNSAMREAIAALEEEMARLQKLAEQSAHLAGDLKDAAAAASQGLDIARKLAAQDPGNAQAQRDVTVSLTNLGDVKLQGGDGAGALAAYQESLDIARRLAAQDPGNAQAQRDVSVSLNKLGDVKLQGGDGAGALAAYQKSLDIRHKLAAQDPGNAQAQRDVSVSLEKLGNVKLQEGDGAGALAADQESLDIRRKLAAQDPSNAQAQRDVAASLNNRCWTRVIIGQQLQQALLDCSESLRIQPNDAYTLDSRGFAYLKLDQFDNAIVDFNAALKINSKLASSLYGRSLAKLTNGDGAAADADLAAAKAIKADIAEELAGYGIK
jgi:tetratricopeptide (TPR) repeat protein